MKTGHHGRALIKSFESFSSAPYTCPGGKKTIGYGHVIRDGEKYIALSGVAAEDVLTADLAEAERTLNAQNLTLTQNQFDALVSFIFNVGSGTFLRSSVLESLKQGHEAEAMENLRKYTKHKVGGVLKDSPGLSRRRNAEAALFHSKN